MIDTLSRKNRINELIKTLSVAYASIAPDKIKAEIKRLTEIEHDDGFWNDVDNAQKVSKELKRLEANHLVTTHSEECNGRLRKFYTITGEGYQKILDYLDDFKELMKVYRYIERKADNER